MSTTTARAITGSFSIHQTEAADLEEHPAKYPVEMFDEWDAGDVQRLDGGEPRAHAGTTRLRVDAAGTVLRSVPANGVGRQWGCELAQAVASFS